MIDLDQPVRAYWKQRLHRHFSDHYRGRPLIKFPEDLRTYQKVIEATQPNVIIELGTCSGGSAMWFRDQMYGMVDRRVWVITVDINDSGVVHKGVIPLVGDLRDEQIINRVAASLSPDDRVMIVEDSAHTYEVTSAALRLYGGFVTPGCYFVVEDGIVDEPDLTIWPGGPTGVQPAIVDFLATEAGQAFKREWLEEFGLTMHMGGWLRKGEA